MGSISKSTSTEAAALLCDVAAQYDTNFIGAGAGTIDKYPSQDEEEET